MRSSGRLRGRGLSIGKERRPTASLFLSIHFFPPPSVIPSLVGLHFAHSIFFTFLLILVGHSDTAFTIRIVNSVQVHMLSVLFFLACQSSLFDCFVYSITGEMTCQLHFWAVHITDNPILYDPSLATGKTIHAESNL